MKVAIILLCAALCGCCLFSRRPDRPDPPPGTDKLVPPACDRLPYGDLRRYTVGEWVKYYFRSSDGYHLTIKSISVEGAGVWVETITERGEKKEISLQLIDLDGHVRCAYFSDGATRPQAQEIRKFPFEAVTPREYSDQESAEVIVAVAGRPVKGRQVKKTYCDAEGVVRQEVYVFSGQIPQLFSVAERGIDRPSALGGLVRRQVDGQEVELEDFGTGAKSSFEIPR